MTETTTNTDSTPLPLHYAGAADAAPSMYRPALHAIAVATAVVTFPLIFMGGLVTSHGAGMSVPDWPNSYGYNMFLFPISQWRGGIFFEHTHRLMGTVVGFASVLLVLCAWGTGRSRTVRRLLWGGAGLGVLIAAVCGVMLAFVSTGGERGPKLHAALTQSVIGWAGIALVLACATFMRRREPRRWVRWLATGVLAAVIFQGVLGGLRVVWVDLDLAIVHACVAQAFFCLAALTAVVTSSWWHTAPDLSGSPEAAAGWRVIVAGVVAFVAIYAQLIVGATMRHYQAGLAVPDLPLAYGQVIPATDAASLDKINQFRAWQLHLGPVTAGQIWLHMGHRIGAVVVTIALVGLIALAWRRRRVRTLRVLAATLAVLLVGQIALGVLTVLYRKPADIASAHVAVGALTLMITFVLTVRSIRLYQRGRRAGRATVAEEQTESRRHAAAATAEADLATA